MDMLLSSAGVGAPVHATTFSIWLIVEVPGNRAFP